LTFVPRWAALEERKKRKTEVCESVWYIPPVLQAGTYLGNALGTGSEENSEESNEEGDTCNWQRGHRNNIISDSTRVDCRTRLMAMQ